MYPIGLPSRTTQQVASRWWNSTSRRHSLPFSFFLLKSTGLLSLAHFLFKLASTATVATQTLVALHRGLSHSVSQLLALSSAVTLPPRRSTSGSKGRRVAQSATGVQTNCVALSMRFLTRQHSTLGRCHRLQVFSSARFTMLAMIFQSE